LKYTTNTFTIITTKKKWLRHIIYGTTKANIPLKRDNNIVRKI